MLEEGSLLFAADKVNESIASTAAIDIYVYSENTDAKIRVDLP